MDTPLRIEPVRLPVLSPRAGQSLLAARNGGDSAVAISSDLGLTQGEALLDRDGVTFPTGERLSWPHVEAIAAHDPACFEVREDGPWKVQLFSEELNRVYVLLPTTGAPTMLVSGIPMHRIKEIDPHDDTLRKMRCVAPVGGRVLDICTGLGYTAVEASRTAMEVTTLELDPTVLELARHNPWSRDLFTRANIRQMVGDASELLPTFPAETFTRVFHDPPTFRLAGDLYSGAFYRELHRVLQPRGRLFHYIGDLESTTGSRVAQGAIRRLHEAGFAKVERRVEAFGLVAIR